MKPNFLVIGAPKAATTSLCHHLGRHPSVFMSRPKETFFFSHDAFWAKGWGWYESLFEGAEGYAAAGEGTTVYANRATYPEALPRIAEHLPDAKIIYIVRHPLDRIQSYWVEMHSQGLVTAPFNTAVREDEQFLDTSRYWSQLDAYRQHFSDERILVLFYEDFSRDAQAVLASCFRFLGVDDTAEMDGADRPRYVSEGKRRDTALANTLRRRLPGFYALRNAAPKPLREAAKRLMKRPIEGKPVWDPAVRRWAAEQLADEARLILEYCDRPASSWDLGLQTPREAAG